MDSGGPKEASIRWGPDPPYEGTIITGKDMPDNTAVSCAKMAEPIDLLFGLWTWVDQRKQKLNHIQPYVKLLWPLVLSLIAINRK